MIIPFIFLIFMIPFLGLGCFSDFIPKKTPQLGDPGFPVVLIDPPVGGDELTVMEDGDTVADTPVRFAAPIYEDYSQKKFQTALANRDPIYLFFCSDSSDACAQQKPINQQVIRSHAAYLHAFSVRILDDETTADEQDLSAEYDVVFDQTAILIDIYGREVFRTIGPRTAEELKEDLLAISRPLSSR